MKSVDKNKKFYRDKEEFVANELQEARNKAISKIYKKQQTVQDILKMNIWPTK